MSLTAVKQAHKRFDQAVGAKAKAYNDLIKTVKEARKQHSVVEIGQALGMTRQGVYDLLKR